MLIRSLGTAAVHGAPAIAQVELLGTEARPQWRQTPAGLEVDLTKIKPPADYAAALRIHLQS